MERRMKSKGFHARSKSLPEEPVDDIRGGRAQRQPSYDDLHTKKNAEQDVWMNSFSSWKMKRMKATSTERDRKAERDEVEESHDKLQRRKSKTFREIVEEKQRREKLIQSGSIDVDAMAPGEITQILADLPSTNLDSDNEQENQKPPPSFTEVTDDTHRRQPRRKTKDEADHRKKEVGEKLYEPEVVTTTYTRKTYAAPTPSVREKVYEPEIITTTDSRKTYAAPPPSYRQPSPPITRQRNPEPVKEPEPVSFHDRLLKAHQTERDIDSEQLKATEAARKKWKPKRSSIFDKIRAFDSGEAFKKPDGDGGAPKVQNKNHSQPDGAEGDHEDMVIIMSQRARSQHGFGFQTSGGYDEGKPLIVSSVSPASVADYSDLKVGDEILNINKENTRRFNQDDVHQCLSQSILTGKLTCKVRRYPDGKRPETLAPQPVFQRSSAPRQESKPPPTQSQPVPVHRPTRSTQPPTETAPPKKEPVEADMDVLRPGPTKNALARARQMLDDLELDEKDESSSRSSDLTDPSLVTSRSYANNKQSQPIKTNGHLPNAKSRNSLDSESISSEDGRSQPTYRPALQTQQIVSHHTPTSSLDEGSAKNYEVQPQSNFISVMAPKSFQIKAPAPYKPPSWNGTANSNEDVSNTRTEVNHRRNDFFPDHIGNDKPLDEMDNLWRQVEEPFIANDEDQTETVPTQVPIKPATAHRKPFNRDEERKRLERWNEEQERRRQEKYELEQQRLAEEQERALQAAVEDVQRKREEEERASEQRRLAMQKQQEEMRLIRQRQIEEEENRRKAKLEQDRLEWEHAQRERAEEERRRQESMEKERRMREEEEKQRAAQEKEEQERQEREQQERERKESERAAREKFRKEQEEYAKMVQEKEKERRAQERIRAEEEQQRLEEEEAEKERREMERWKKESEERERSAKLKAEEERVKQEEAKMKFEEQERDRIRAEERARARQEWEDERKRELEQLRLEKEQLQKEREELAKHQDEERKKLMMEIDRIRKEKIQEQKTAPVIEVPVSKISNGEVMSKPPMGMTHSPRNGHSPRTASPGTQRIQDNNKKNMIPERDHPPSHSIMSHYQDPSIPTSQHWLIEEAERRRRAEEQGIDRKMQPDLIAPPQHEVHPPQKPPHAIPRHPNPYPRGFEPEPPTRIPPQRKLQSHEAPASTTGVQRRLRGPEKEADRQRKMLNRRSLPDLAAGRDNAVMNNPRQTTEPPIGQSTDPGQHTIPGQGSAFQEPNKNIPPNQAISGKMQCCNCDKSLGRGAAMIIESLGLHYHLDCFRCCVCSIQLGNGTKGTDVRIRASQLHCQNCYSNEAGFQFTEV